MKIQQYITEKEKDELKLYGIINVIEKYCMPFIKHMKRVGLDDWFYRGSRTRLDDKKLVKIKPRKDRRTVDMDEEMQEYLDDQFYNEFGWRPRSEGVFATSRKSSAKNYGQIGIFLPIGKKYKFVYNPRIDDLFGEIDDNIGSIPDREIIRDDFLNDGSIENEWEWEFGEDTAGGSWYYDNDDTMESQLDDAKNQIIRNVIDDGDAEDEDEADLMVDDSLFEWMPEITFSEYIDEKTENRYDEITSNLDYYINGYTDKNLRKAHSSKVEVTFKCKEYFLIDAAPDNILTNHFLLGSPMKPDFSQKKSDFEKDHMFKFVTISE